jgi:hypothetical protein
LLEKSPGTPGSSFSRALRQCKQVVRLHSVSFGLDVFVAVVRGDNYFHDPTGSVNEEFFTAFDFCDAGGLGDLESYAARSNSTNVLNSFVGIIAIGLVDASDLVPSHSSSFRPSGQL